MTKLYVKGYILKEAILEELKKEDGLGTIEIAVIIIALIGLALLFRTNIEAFLGELFDQMNAPTVNNTTN